MRCSHGGRTRGRRLRFWGLFLIGVLSSTAASFPEHLWCQIIPQAKRQLLLLRQSTTNPKISAYAHVYGPHDYNVTSFVPVGMETLVHNKLKRCRTFAEHCSKGFILGTSFDHYRAWTMWMTDTRSTHVSATVYHKHKYPTTPTVTPADRVLAAVKKLSEEIKGRMSLLSRVG